MLLYSVLKAVFRPALRVFYADGGTTGTEHLPETGPLVVVANHPNTLLDPLLVGMLWRRELRFLTTSKFFRGVGGWVLRRTGALPVYRQDDHRPATAAALTGAERLAHNDASFRVAFRQLAAGEALLIFPEGTSEPARGLRPLKPGVARIALGAEARHGWRLGVQILPVGLNYAEAPRFRSGLRRCVGPPIRVADYRARYEANPAAAVRALTQDVRGALAGQLAIVSPPELDALLYAIEHLTPGRAPDVARTRALSDALRALSLHDPARLAALRRQVFSLLRVLHRLGLPAEALAAPASAGRAAVQAAGLLLSAPVAAWGAINNALAFGLPPLLLRRLRLAVEFGPSLLVVSGIATVMVSYALQTALVAWLTASAGWAAGYLLSVPLAGAFAWRYHGWWRGWRGRRRAAWLAWRRPRLLAALRAERAAVRANVST